MELNRIESHAKKNATIKMPQQLESGEVRDEKQGCSPFPLDLNKFLLVSKARLAQW
jgi:hypothetical protein